MVITYRFDGMFDRSLDIGGIGEGLDTKEGERNKRNMKFFQIFKICFVEIENRIINGESKKKSKRNFYYSISVFSMSLEFDGNFGTNSSNVYKKMVEFRNSYDTGDPREVHQILEIQRDPEDFEDCKGIRVSRRSLKGFAYVSKVRRPSGESWILEIPTP